MLCSKKNCDWYNRILLWNDSIKENCRLVLKVSRLYITEGESPWRKYWWSSFQYTHSGHGTPPTHSGHPMASWLVAMYTCLKLWTMPVSLNCELAFARSLKTKLLSVPTNQLADQCWWLVHTCLEGDREWLMCQLQRYWLWCQWQWLADQDQDIKVANSRQCGNHGLM